MLYIQWQEGSILEKGLTEMHTQTFTLRKVTLPLTVTLLAYKQSIHLLNCPTQNTIKKKNTMLSVIL